MEGTSTGGWARPALRLEVVEGQPAERLVSAVLLPLQQQHAPLRRRRRVRRAELRHRAARRAEVERAQRCRAHVALRCDSALCAQMERGTGNW